MDTSDRLSLRLLAVERIGDFFEEHRGSGNKLVVTSRGVGYRLARVPGDGLVECTLLDFGES